jgi:signal peptidase
MEMDMRQIANECFFAWVESEIRSGRSVRFRVKGNSMRPLLRNGKEEVVVEPCGKQVLKPGHVILFRQSGRYVLHRIIQKRGSHYLMQGDGVCRFYEECEETDIIGVVRRVYRPSGKMIETDSVGWRLGSRLWLRLGRFRGVVLCVLNRVDGVFP